ncbi:hypothetical protein HHK36_002795 [Tetracentron sinense]|uniref:Uncharacterized protein n=1 Tax=Tetracentron sinense TaxID=13715 RepID=A0A834ZMV6_TETSI|nr:hypothetical protein HHK36_002795 [Tetracentron sinense]
MGRAPCCDKANVKKGPWSPEEDAKLKAYIEQHGTGGNWIALPQKIGANESSVSHKEQQLRSFSCLEQEMKKGSGNFMVADNGNQNPYWPELPVTMSLPYPNQDPCINQNAPIKKLLLKLGGRFSDEDKQPNCNVTNLQCPLDISSTQQKLYVNSTDMLSSSGSVNSLNNPCSDQLRNTQYGINGVDMHMLQGHDSYPVQLDEIVYSNPQAQRLDWLECFYGVDMVNASTGTNSEERSNWDNTRSMVYPPIISNYEGFQQGTLQQCGFESGYLESK